MLKSDDLTLIQEMRQEAFTLSREFGRTRTVTVTQMVENGTNVLGEPEFTEIESDPIELRIRHYSPEEILSSGGYITGNDIKAISPEKINIHTVITIDGQDYRVKGWKQREYGDYVEYALHLQPID
ncbi:MAG: hypothetical protein D6712_17830 [Chloroflexi bacterium]|nr:MAG: hypothetical protein D6712_17830 [Chloroflexota bacterium]